jgi:hypothetical protein
MIKDIVLFINFFRCWKNKRILTWVHMVPFRREARASWIVVVPVETEVLESNQLEDALGLPVDGTGLPLAKQ